MESPQRGNGKKGSTYAAAIDLGSNSFRLLICEFDGCRLKPLVNRLETVGLGRNLSPGYPLSPAARLQAEKVLRSFGLQLQPYAPRFLRACGTEALRQAADSASFLIMAGTLLGCEVEILSGFEEAHLTFKAVVSALDAPPPPVLMIDAGGGSTEMVCLQKDAVSPCIFSVPIGALNLTDRFAGAENGDPAALQDLRRHVAGILAPFVKELEPAGNFRLIGSGGTATAMAALALALREYDPRLVHGYRLSAPKLEEIGALMIRLSAAERCLLPGLEKGRGRIIVAGMEIFRTLLDLVKAEEMTVSDAGLLEGILLSALPCDGNLVRL